MTFPRLSGFTRLFSCMTAGVVGAIGMGPFYIWPALLLSLSVFWILFTGFAEDKKWKSFLAGFLYGFGFFVASLWWIGNALLVGGNPYLWAYPLAVCGLPALLALFTMLATGMTRILRPGRSFSATVTFMALMILAELARSFLFTGFPWNLFGMAWTNNLPMLQVLSVGGIHLLSALTLIMFVSPAFLVKGQAPRAIRAAVFILALVTGAGLYIFGNHRLAAHPTTYNPDVVVQIIQPSIKQEDKWDGTKQWDNYRAVLNLIKPELTTKFQTPPTTRVLVLPETAINYFELSVPQAKDALRGRLAGYTEEHVYMLTGALLKSADGQYHNSLISLDRNTDVLATFDKFHLVPFGEYIPFQKYIPIGPIVQFSGFAEGAGPQTITLDQLPPFSPLVCYEVIFPGNITTSQPTRPQWIVNSTNDAWYGISAGPFQHMAHAIYRAIEEGVPVVRSANTGISVVVDPVGRVLIETGLFNPDSPETLLPLPLRVPTRFSQL